MHRFLFLLCAFSASANTPCSDEMDLFWQFLDDNNDKVTLYVDAYKHIAISEMDRSGVPASIKMAQGLLESGIGESELAKKANNHFGIKCGGDWTGETYYLWDDEPQKSCFRVYPSVEECYVAHTDFLTNPAKEYRYGFLFKLEKTDYKAWAKGLQSAGYATSQTYSEKLISLIERYELFKLDYLTAQTIAATEAEVEEFFGDNPHIFELADTTATTTAAVAVISIPDPFHSGENIEVVSLSQEVFDFHGLKAVFIQPADDLKSISDRYHISAAKLLKYNELKGQSLKVGHYLFLEKKNAKYKGKNTTHVVHLGETMHDISQRYGIQLKTLTKNNPKYSEKQPPAGTRLFLNKKA